MSCNCDVQISDLSNRIVGLESDIGNIYTSSTSSLTLSNAIIQQYANISNVVVSGLYLGNLKIGNVTSLTGNLRVSNVISSSANSLFWADGLGEKLYLQATGAVLGGEGNTIVYMGGNANVVGNVRVGGGGAGGERVARAYQWRVKNDVTETLNGNRALLSVGRPQIEYVFTNPWSLRTIGANQWNSVCWSPKLGLFCAVASTGVANRVATSPDGLVWTARSTSGLDQSWNSVCWSPELGIFCAVASSGAVRIMTSSDGVTWTGQTTPEANAWNSVCWSPELYLFCAVASSGTNRVMVSSNGTSWTAYPASSAVSWTSVVWSYENRILLAVASDSATIMYSASGTIWTSGTGVAVGATSVCWSSYQGLFCVVGTGSVGNYVATSPDGLTWTARTPATTRNWRSVIWVPEMKTFLATNSDATGNSVMYSFNGITWTTDTASYPGVMYGYGLAWSSELGIVAEIGTSSLRTSPSIYAFNAFTSTLLTTSNNFVVNQNGIFVNATTKYVGIGNTNPQNDLDIYGNIIVGKGPGNYNTSTTVYTFNNYRPFGWDSDGDGNLNVTQTAGKNFIIRGGVSDSALVIFAVNGSTNSSFTNNGYLIARDYILRNANLTISQGMSVGGNVVAVDYVNNKVGFNLGNLSSTSNIFGVGGSANIAGNLNATTNYANVFTGTVSYSRGRHISSKTTTQIPAYGVPQRDYTISRFRGGTYPMEVSTTGWNTLIWSPQQSIFVSLSGNGNNTRAMTSPDGITWTSRTLGNQAWTDIGWSPELGLFIGIPNNSSSIVTSPDGITWTTVNTGTGVTNWVNIAWAPELGIFCVIGVSTVSTRVMTSPNGTTWTLRDSLVYNQWRTICWSPDLSIFVVASDSGSLNRVMTSPDGIVWTARTTPNGSYYGSAWSPELGLFAVVGSSTCITSPDGVVWTTRSVSGNMWFDIIWSPSLRLFCAISTASSGASIMTSPDGVVWTGRTPTINMSGRAIAWSEELGIFCLVGNSLSVSVGNSVVISESMYAYHPYDYNIYGNLAVSGNILYVGATTGNVGILTITPTANLEVNGEAAKTGGGNWSTSSDARVKEDILKADTQRCYEIVKNLDLKYYRYREDTVPYQYDRHSLGWIAQEAEIFFPKSILTANLYGISDLKLLDSDQIMKCMYGALEELVPKLDRLEELVNGNEEKRIELMSRRGS